MDDLAFRTPSALVGDAYEFAAAAHAGQVKDSDGLPYLDHAVEVARLVEDAGFDDEVVAAALLHDVPEHAGCTLDQIAERFGPGVTELVAAMTDPPGDGSWEARKRLHRERIAAAGPRAEAIFTADKAVNAASLRRAIHSSGEAAVASRLGTPLEERVDHYQATLELFDTEVASPLARHLREELQRLGAERRIAGNGSQDRHAGFSGQ
jgi:(p)ppGpp synthase/HD superfamily hydrolase